MKNPMLQKYVSLHEQLMREKRRLEAQLAEINRALGVQAAAAGRQQEANGVHAGGRKRARNEKSLKEVVLQVTKAKPLSRQELLEAVKGVGYVFTAKDPLNSLSTLLYTDKDIKNTGGKFGPR